jgi:molybdate transport system regulatory protein
MKPLQPVSPGARIALGAAGAMCQSRQGAVDQMILAAADETTRTSARNQLAGVVIERIDSEVNSEITLELDVGKTLTATLTHASADELKLTVGARALALIKASHVILVVE